MARRFSETVNIQQVDTRTGAVQAFSGLADRLSQFSSQLGAKTVQVAQRESLQAGLESGQAVQLRDESGQLITPEFKEKPRFIGGIEVAAHNKALRAGYLAELNNDNRVAVSEIMAQNPNSILKFNDAAKGYVDGVLKGVEPSVRAAVSEDLNNMVTSARIRVQGADIQRQRKENIEGLSLAGEGAFESAANLMRNGDGLSAGEAMLEGVKVVDSMVEAGYITEAQGQIRKNEANQELAEQGFRLELDNIVKDEGVQTAFARLDEMDGKPPKGFTPDQWDTFIASAQADVNQARVRASQLESKVNIEQERQISNLKIRARTGAGDPSGIVKETEDFFDRGVINESERTSILTSLINGQSRAQKEAEDLSSVAKRLGGNKAIVVDDKISDKYYETVLMPAFEEMTPEEIENEKVNYVDKLKRVPDAMQSELNTFMLSGDPVLMRSALNFIDKVDDIPGVLDSSFSTEQRALVKTAVDLSANLEPAEAIAKAQELTDPTNTARVDFKESVIKENDWRADYIDNVKDVFNPIGPFQGTQVSPVTENLLAKEYGKQFEANFKAGMSETAARNKAKQIIQRNWKKSEVTGVVMKYRPDDYYSINGDVEYIRNQLVEDVNAATFDPIPFTADELFLQSTEETARAAAQGNPFYRVVVVRDGTMLPISDFPWFPDMQKELDKQESANQKRIESQRKKQAEGIKEPFARKGAGGR